MVRNYVRKTDHGSWSESNMKEAIKSVIKNEMPLRQAARTFGVPKDTLNRRLKKLDKQSTDDNIDTMCHNKLGTFRTVLSKDQEKQLAKYITDMDNAFFGLTIMDLSVIVYEFCDKNKIPNPFSKEKKLCGEDFVRGFLKRNPDLSLRKPQGVALNRVYGLNRTAVRTYFSNLEKLLTEHNFQRHRIYNCDESGITSVHKPVKVVAKKGKHCVSSVTSGEKGITTTVLCAASGTGHYIPPMMIFKRKNKKDSLTDHAPVGTLQGVSDNGWINTELFLQYTRHFIKYTNCTKENPALMIFDGHKTHTKSLQLIDLARDNGLFLLSLTPHTTHKLQPLDRSFFKPLKTHYNNACQKWMRNHPGRRIQTENLGELFNEAYVKSATMENAVSGFRTSGIVPFNPDVVPEHEYMEDPCLLVTTSSATSGEVANSVDEIEVNVPEARDNESHDECLYLNESVTTRATTPPTQSLAPATYPVSSPLGADFGASPRSSTPKSPTPRTQSPQSSTSFEDILATPKLCFKRSRRGEVSEIITSSPYKRKLQSEKEQQAQKSLKTNKRKGKAKNTKVKNKRKPKEKNIARPVLTECENDRSDWICPVCSGNWKESETDWIVCTNCTAWVHKECTSDEICFLCD